MGDASAAFRGVINSKGHLVKEVRQPLLKIFDAVSLGLHLRIGVRDLRIRPVCFKGMDQVVPDPGILTDANRELLFCDLEHRADDDADDQDRYSNMDRIAAVAPVVAQEQR